MTGCRVLVCWASILTLPIAGRGQVSDPCPKGRTLDRQIALADVVALGEITYERDCLPPQGSRNDRISGDCSGRRADVLVVRTWKGHLAPKDGMALIVPTPKDSMDLVLRKGEKRVIFAKRIEGAPTQWWGYANACLYPENPKSDQELIKQLDTWKQRQNKGP